jgi:hypothetical protein
MCTFAIGSQPNRKATTILDSDLDGNFKCVTISRA